MPRSTTLRALGVAVRAMLVLTVMLGVVYTLAITGIGQLLMPHQANGSIVATASGTPAGSALIGQSFTDKNGEALPEYFQSRPSAVDYDAGTSGGSNLGPENDDLIAAIAERRAAIAGREGVAESAVPADAVTASASGLDPDISADYALLQVPRIAAERGLAEEAVRALVESKLQGRDLGFLGDARVNVVALNLALDAQEE